MKNILFILLLLCSVPSLKAQPLFLPLALNTLYSDYINGFTEYGGNFYFCGKQVGSPYNITKDSVKGFCFKTNASGQVLRRFDLSGMLRTPYVTLESIGQHANNIYMTGTLGTFDTLDNLPHFNKVFVLCLDTNLNFNRLDTFSYGLNSSASIRAFRTEFLQERIIMAFSSTLGDMNANPIYSYLIAYNYYGNQLHSRRIDSTFINMPLYSDRNELIGMTKHSEQAVLLSMGNHYDVGTVASYQLTSSLFLVDTAMTVLERVDTIEYRPLDTFNKGPFGFYNQNIKHPSGTYFLGPSIADIRIFQLGLAKLNHRRDTILTTRSLLPRINSTDTRAIPAFKMPLRLLKNQKEIVLLGNSNHDIRFTPDPTYLRVAKYDTSLNLLWHRTFERTNTSFTPMGIYELSDNRLMVLASSYDYTTPSTIDSNYNFYVFVLDSTGTPLSTFTLPSPSENTVTLYPNPAQNEIRFQLPEGTSKATYFLTDLGGRTVLSGSYFSGNAVPVGALPAALYLYKIQTADGVWHSGMFQKQ